MLEKDIERKSVNAAAARGWLSYKFTSPARRGVPDRIFIKRGRVIFIEFKRPGKDVTALQTYEMRRINEAGCTCGVSHSVEETLCMLGEPTPILLEKKGG